MQCKAYEDIRGNYLNLFKVKSLTALFEEAKIAETTSYLIKIHSRRNKISKELEGNKEKLVGLVVALFVAKKTVSVLFPGSHKLAGLMDIIKSIQSINHSTYIFHLLTFKFWFEKFHTSLIESVKCLFVGSKSLKHIYIIFKFIFDIFVHTLN